jgi:hypothetical protein
MEIDTSKIKLLAEGLANCVETPGLAADDPVLLRFLELSEKKEAGTLTP